MRSIVTLFENRLNADPREACLLWNNHTLSGSAIALPPEERARTDRLAQQQARHLRRAEFAARRVYLADLLDVTPTGLAIDYHPEGQPFLPDFPSLSLSTSHSEGWSALALAEDRAIGLDIERVRPLDWQPMLSMICDEAERAAFLSAEPDLIGFFRLWTIKEAVLKATGQGFRAGPKAIQISNQHLRPAPSRFTLEAHGTRYQIETARHDEITAAIAITRDPPPPRTSA